MVPPWSSENQSLLIFPSSSDLRSFHFHPEEHLMITTGQPEWNLSHQHSCQEEGRTKGRASQLSAPFKEVFSGKLQHLVDQQRQILSWREQTGGYRREGGGVGWNESLLQSWPFFLPRFQADFSRPDFVSGWGCPSFCPFTQGQINITPTQDPVAVIRKEFGAEPHYEANPLVHCEPSQGWLLGTGATEVQRQVGYRCWGARQNRTPTVYLEFHVNYLGIWMDKKAIRFDKM